MPDVHEPIDNWTMLLVVVTALAQIGAWIIILVLAAINYRAVVHHWRGGLALAIALLALSLPLSAFELLYFDPGDDDHGLSPEVLRTVRLSTILFQLALSAAWTFVVYCAAVWIWWHARPQAVPLFTRDGSTPRRRIWRPIALGGAIGGAYGIISSAALLWLEVSESTFIRNMLVHYPGFEDAPALVPLSIGLIVGLSAAVVEELEFRGVLLGFVARISGNHTLAVWAGNVAIALLFAALHLINTDAPGLKFTQIFIFGLLAGECARRWSLESAIAAHLGLNVFAVAIDLAARA